MKKNLIPLLTVLLFYACTPMENPSVALYGVSIDQKNVSIDFGASYTLHATVTPKRSNDNLTLVWTSGNPAIVAIDQNGVLTALGHGEATISVIATSAEKSFTATCNVKVVPAVVNIPDEAFRNYCLQIADANRDSILTTDETSIVTRISVNNMNISSLEGLRYFPALLDLSCGSNQLTSLDVRANPALQYLSCGSNQLTGLDVSANPALQTLSCSYNPLTGLDVSANPALKYCLCNHNQLTDIDMSANPVLQILSCAYNQLTILDVSANPELQDLSCSYNQLTGLDVSANPALRNLSCSYNQLTSLDVSANSTLQYLYCSYNSFLTTVWLKTGQTVANLTKDSHTDIKYK